VPTLPRAIRVEPNEGGKNFGSLFWGFIGGLTPDFFPSSFGPTLMARGSVGAVRLDAVRPR